MTYKQLFNLVASKRSEEYGYSSDTKNLDRLEFTDLILNDVDLSTSTLEKTVFTNVQVFNSDLKYCFFINSSFDNVTFSNVNFTNVYFENCEFKNTKFENCIFKDATIFYDKKNESKITKQLLNELIKYGCILSKVGFKRKFKYDETTEKGESYKKMRLEADGKYKKSKRKSMRTKRRRRRRSSSSLRKKN